MGSSGELSLSSMRGPRADSPRARFASRSSWPSKSFRIKVKGRLSLAAGSRTAAAPCQVLGSWKYSSRGWLSNSKLLPAQLRENLRGTLNVFNIFNIFQSMMCNSPLKDLIKGANQQFSNSVILMVKMFDSTLSLSHYVRSWHSLTVCDPRSRGLRHTPGRCPSPQRPLPEKVEAHRGGARQPCHEPLAAALRGI